MNNQKFIADVEAFAKKTIDQMERVAKQSVQDVLEDAQTPVAQGGDMPVDTGFLRNSLVVRIGGTQRSKGGDDFILGLSTMKLGNTITAEWTAKYAIPRHYMAGNKTGGGLWRDKAAQKWAFVVAKNARLVQ